MHFLSRGLAIPMTLVLLVTLSACTSVQPPASPTAGAGPQASKAAPKSGGKLTFAARQDPDTLDPQRTGFVATRKLLNQMFDTLTVVKHGDPKVYPGLAESWTVSEDGKFYTFKLKRGVKFHDGTPFNAEAVKFSFDRILEPAQAKGGARSFLGPYQSSEVVDEYTVKLSFERPNSALPTLLAIESLAPISPAAVQKYGDDFERNPVGTGAFKFKEWVAKDHVTLVRNPDYNWASEAFEHQGPAYLDEIVWKFIPEATTRVAVLETGEVDIAEELAYQDVQRVRENANLKVERAVPAGTPWTAFPNVKKFPTDQLSVRQALLYAIDREAIAKTIFRSESKAAVSVLLPNSPGYAATFADYNFDPSKAKATLEDDGWKLGPDGVRTKDGKRLEMLWIYGSQEGYEEMVPLVQAMVRDVGIDLKVEEQTRANQLDAYSKDLHNIGNTQWWFPDPSILGTVFHSRSFQASNRSKYSNPEVDKLLDDALTVADPRRAELYKQVQEQVAKDAVAIPLVDQVTLVGMKKTANGYKFNAVTLPLLYDVHF